jgi:hypothetical protein
MDDLMILHAKARIMRSKQANEMYVTPSGFVTPRPKFKAELPFQKTTAEDVGEGYFKDDGSIRNKIKGFAARLAATNVGQAMRSFHNNWWGGQR